MCKVKLPLLLSQFLLFQLIFSFPLQLGFSHLVFFQFQLFDLQRVFLGILLLEPFDLFFKLADLFIELLHLKFVVLLKLTDLLFKLLLLQFVVLFKLAHRLVKLGLPLLVSDLVTLLLVGEGVFGIDLVKHILVTSVVGVVQFLLLVGLLQKQLVLILEALQAQFQLCLQRLKGDLRQRRIVLQPCLRDGVVVIQNSLVITLSGRCHSVLVSIVHTHLATFAVACAGHAGCGHLLGICAVLVRLLLPIYIRSALLLGVVHFGFIFLLLDLLNGKIGLLLLQLALRVRPFLGGIDLSLIVFIRLVDHAAVGLLQVAHGLLLVRLYLVKSLIVIIDFVFVCHFLTS